MTEREPEKEQQAAQKQREDEARKAQAEQPKSAEELGKKVSDQHQEAVEKGYAEDALTEDQKRALEHEDKFRKDAEKLQDADEGDDYVAKRTQV